jgi:hypothetical protein
MRIRGGEGAERNNNGRSSQDNKEGEITTTGRKMEGEVPLIATFFECVAEVRDSPKFFKILRIEIENYPIIIRMGMY